MRISLQLSVLTCIKIIQYIYLKCDNISARVSLLSQPFEKSLGWKEGANQQHTGLAVLSISNIIYLFICLLLYYSSLCLITSCSNSIFSDSSGFIFSLSELSITVSLAFLSIVHIISFIFSLTGSLK